MRGKEQKNTMIHETDDVASMVHLPLFVEKIDIVYDSLIGKVLADKYRIDQLLDKNLSGKIYLVTDI